MNITTARLNELLEEVLRRRSGLVTPDERAFKPWLPESYWREKREREHAAAVAGRIFDAAAEVKERRRVEDERLANMSVEELLDDNIPKLWDRRPADGWGTRSVRPTPYNTQPPTPGRQSPAYHWQCYQCGRPITIDGYDHDHKRDCDLLLVDPVDVETDSCYEYHTPKPWQGEEEDDDEE